MKLKLSTAAVRKVTPPLTAYQLWWDSELCGFGLRVTASGARCFFVEKRVQGRTRRVSLGRWPAVTVAAARKRARVHLGKVAAGEDPTAESSRETLVTITLEEAFRDYVTLKRRSKDGKALKTRTQTDMMASCDTVLKGWKQRALISLTRPMIEQRYREECERSVVQANMAMKYLRAVFNFTAERQVDSDGRPLLADNPENVLRHQWRGVPRRKRVMNGDELQRWVPAVLGLGQAPIRPPGAGSCDRSCGMGRSIAIYFSSWRSPVAAPMRPDTSQWPTFDWRAEEVTFRDTKNRLDHTLPLTPYLREAAPSPGQRGEVGSGLLQSLRWSVAVQLSDGGEARPRGVGGSLHATRPAPAGRDGHGARPCAGVHDQGGPQSPVRQRRDGRLCSGRSRDETRGATPDRGVRAGRGTEPWRSRAGALGRGALEPGKPRASAMRLAREGGGRPTHWQSACVEHCHERPRRHPDRTPAVARSVHRACRCTPQARARPDHRPTDVDSEGLSNAFWLLGVRHTLGGCFGTCS